MQWINNNNRVHQLIESARLLIKGIHRIAIMVVIIMYVPVFIYSSCHLRFMTSEMCNCFCPLAGLCKRMQIIRAYLIKANETINGYEYKYPILAASTVFVGWLTPYT